MVNQFNVGGGKGEKQRRGAEKAAGGRGTTNRRRERRRPGAKRRRHDTEKKWTRQRQNDHGGMRRWNAPAMPAKSGRRTARTRERAEGRRADKGEKQIGATRMTIHGQRHESRTMKWRPQKTSRKHQAGGSTRHDHEIKSMGRSVGPRIDRRGEIAADASAREERRSKRTADGKNARREATAAAAHAGRRDRRGKVQLPHRNVNFIWRK